MARFGRTQKASALLPLAVLSAAWTAGLATTGSDASAAADPQALPDGSRVPAQAVKAPASLTPPRSLGPGVAGHTHQVVSTASASGIPSVALAAYQRAATVINAADHSCRMPWQLVAAIGRVESDHGRADGNVLTDRGVAKPGIYGPALDGTHGTTLIKDTDAGQYDHDSRYDRAVGPMQFIPSTWAIVGVDADNDGQRNPQDVYDAALGSAV
jgi:membrane-bound lytic murein transglycosylase B